MIMAAALTELPPDVRLMNGLAQAAFIALALLLLGAALAWAARAPWLPIRQLRIEGELLRNNAATLRANAMPRLTGNFIGMNLQQARAAFEAVPWVRQATVTRVWPDKLVVRLVEHRAAALWQAEDGSERLVNMQGEVFDANLGDVEDDDLPTLAGPAGTSLRMLALLHKLVPLAQALDAEINTLTLSGRGSWRAELDSGAVLELGRGSDEEIIERGARFVRTLGQVHQAYPAPLEYADLRHAQGYAVRLRGITTLAPAAARKK